MEEYRLPEETHIGYADLRTADLERSLRFYHGLLGLEVTEGSAKLAALASRPGDRPFLVIQQIEAPAPRLHRAAGLYHIAIRYPTRESLGWVLNRIVEGGWALQGASDHGVSEALYTVDPDGNGVELYRDRPRAEWPRDGNQVSMFTDGLNLDALLADADAGKQTPAGVDMGHVHLQVSDLDLAQEVYHRLLGLDITQASYPGALFMSAGGYHHHLGANIWGGRGIPAAPENTPGLVSLSLVLPDAASRGSLLERLRASGRSVTDIEIPGWGTVPRVAAMDGVSVDLVIARNG